MGQANSRSANDIKRFERLHKSALRRVPDYFEHATQNLDSAISKAQVTSLDPIEGHEFLRNNPHLIKELNEAVETVLANVITHQEETYKKEDLLRLYKLNKEEVSKDLDKIIIEHLQNKYPLIMQVISTIIEQAAVIFMQEVLTNLDNFKKNPNESRTLEQYRLQHKEFKRQITRIIREELGPINDLLTISFIARAGQNVEMAILKSYDTNQLKGNRLLGEPMGYQLKQYVEDLLKIKSFKILDYSRVELGKEKMLTLLSILISLEQFQENGSSSTLDSYNKVIAFLIPKDNKQINDELNDLKKSNSNQAELLKNNIQAWNKESQPCDVLFAASLLFVGFIKVVRHYSSHIRYILVSIFSNLFHNKDQLLPSQILACLESIPTESIEQEEEPRERLRTESKIKAKIILKQIRNTHINSVNEHIRHLDQLKDFNYIFSDLNIKRAEKFVLEKISNPEIVSMNSIICVSGFTSEDTLKSEEWAALESMYPDAEIFALNWKSSTIDSLLPDSLKGVSKNPWTIVPAIAEAYKAGFWPTVHCFISTHNEICDTWGETYQQAIIAGKNLAYYLVQTHLFEGHSISLVGFSLGTLVIMSCIWELEKMKKYDIIYDVLVMGGVAHIDDFYDKTLAAISHRITNCYCTTDDILKGLLKYVNPDVNPIGLGPIYKSNNKVKNIDVTSISDGHLSYREKLEEILLKADLHQDLDA